MIHDQPCGKLLFDIMNPVSAALLVLNEGNFDVLLRRSPVALVAFVNPTTSMHFPNLQPAIDELATRYDRTGILIGQVNSEHNTELLDRFQVEAFPTLLWMDAREKYPYYASEALPERYRGDRSFESLAAFITERTDVAPRSSEDPNRGVGDGFEADRDGQGQDGESGTGADVDAASSLPRHLFQEHDCTQLAATYRACMRHRRDRPQRCSDERHEYLICMSGRWAVPPEHHQEMAQLYGREFAHGRVAG